MPLLEIFVGSADLNPSNVSETAFTAPAQPDLTSIQDSIDIKLKRSDLVHVLGNMKVSNCFVTEDDCTFQVDPATASAVFTSLPSGYELGSAMTDSTGLPAGTSLAAICSMVRPQSGAGTTTATPPSSVG